MTTRTFPEGEAVGSLAHANCVVCSSSNERGLCLSFSRLHDDSVEAEFECRKVFEGYTNMLHGGIISTLLDGAMTNCMFSHGVHAVTAELVIRFLSPVECCRKASVRAWITRSSERLFLLRAELIQDGKTMATGQGKFIRINEHTLPGTEGPAARASS